MGLDLSLCYKCCRIFTLRCFYGKMFLLILGDSDHMILGLNDARAYIECFDMGHSLVKRDFFSLAYFKTYTDFSFDSSFDVNFLVIIPCD